MPDEPDLRCEVDRLESRGLSHEAAIAKLRRKEKAQLAARGFLVHYVFDDPDTPWGINAHSHGVAENFDHPDFQIVANLPPELAYRIIDNLIDEVRAGRRFVAGSTASGIIRNFVVGFANATEGGREVLRIIAPDKEGRTAKGEINEWFGRQYEGTCS